MNWHVLEVDLPVALEDPACAVLEDLGSAGWEIREGPGGELRLLAYWADPLPGGLAIALGRRLGDLADRLRVAHPKIGAPARVPPEDWEAGWRRHFRSERPVPGIVIHPSWIRCERAPGEIAVVIDPKMAFGVGSHPTTRLCLRLLAARGAAARVLDAGTGTGILAIVAALRGATRVAAVDVDAVAVENAAENVRRNGVQDRVRVILGGPDAVKGPFDQILANLLTSELQRALPDLARLLRPGGLLILSGFLVAEEAAVRALLARSGLRVESAAREEEWGGIVARLAY